MWSNIKTRKPKWWRQKGIRSDKSWTFSPLGLIRRISFHFYIFYIHHHHQLGREMFDKIPTLTSTVNNRRFVREWSLIYSRHNTALFERNITVEIKLKENTLPRCAALCTSATFLFTSTFMILYDLWVVLKKVDDGNSEAGRKKGAGNRRWLWKLWPDRLRLAHHFFEICRCSYFLRHLTANFYEIFWPHFGELWHAHPCNRATGRAVWV